jgi:hypothetical protein
MITERTRALGSEKPTKQPPQMQLLNDP